MKPTIRVFTRDAPCTKRTLWECFRGPTGFRTVLVAEAHSVIGVNAPRGMEREGRLQLKKTPRGDYYTLTAEGREWLEKGIVSYVKNHPMEAPDIKHLPGEDKPTARIRRVR